MFFVRMPGRLRALVAALLVVAVATTLGAGGEATAATGTVSPRGSMTDTDRIPLRPRPPIASTIVDPADAGSLEILIETSVRDGSTPVDRIGLQRRNLVRPLLVSDTAPPPPNVSGAIGGRVEARIVNGESIEIDQAPWQVRVNWGCGGTLIQRRWVMTAAHCVEGLRPRNVKVWAGIGNRREMTDDNALAVRAVHVHHRWDPETFEYDIALLRLSAPASGTPVRLFTLDDEPLRDSSAFISGWGFLAADQTALPDQLHGADVTVLAGPGESCGRYGGRVFISELMICAGSSDGTIDACQGDSGGPLAIARDEQWYVAGITSWGVECATVGFPGVYTRVSRLVPWIYRTIGWRDGEDLECSLEPCDIAVVDGLVAGTAYVHRVRAHNAAGWSKWSKPSAAADAG